MSPANTASMPFASSPWRITSSVLVERLKGSSGKPATSTAWGGRWRAPSPSPWPYGCLHLRKVASQTIARILAACITPPRGDDLRPPARVIAKPCSNSRRRHACAPSHAVGTPDLRSASLASTPPKEAKTERRSGG